MAYSKLPKVVILVHREISDDENKNHNSDEKFLLQHISFEEFHAREQAKFLEDLASFIQF
jgi:hypothetical protein